MPMKRMQLFTAIGLMATAMAIATSAFGAAEGCDPACIEPRVFKEQWIIIASDAKGDVLSVTETGIPSSEPLDLWLSEPPHTVSDGSFRTRDNTPLPPPGGTGPVTDGWSTPGTGPDGRTGDWFITITYYFQNGELVNVTTNTYFRARPTPPPGDDQMN